MPSPSIMNDLIETMPIAFEKEARFEKFNKGSYIYHEGDPSEHVFIAIKGRVKLARAIEGSNREFIHHIIYPQEFIGIGEFVSRMKTKRMSAVAIDRGVIVQRVSFFKLEMELRKNHELVGSIINQLIKQRQETWKRFYRRKYFSSKNAVIEALWDIAKERGKAKKKGIVIQAMTHRDLGEYVGICRQNATQALNMLREENKIEYNRNEIIIKVKH